MSGKTRIKIILDLVMALLFILLLDAYGTGLAFHETAGLCIGFLFIFHILLNWPWVKGISRKLLSPALPAKTRLMYALNVISLACISTVIITGIMISQVLFCSGTPADHQLAALHKWISYFSLGLFAVHISLHRRYIINAWKSS